jgi:hypothetical protein
MRPERLNREKGTQLRESVIVWPTPSQRDYKGACASRVTPEGYNSRLDEAVIVFGPPAPDNHSTHGSRLESWLTPNTMDSLPVRSEEALARQYQNNRVGRTTHSTYQVAQWGTPAANDAKKQNVMGEVNSKQAGLAKSVGLELQKQWGTPTARDYKSGRGKEDRDYKELTPMVERTQAGKLNPRWVETLMGLPIGWTMPSCTSPVTPA